MSWLYGQTWLLYLIAFAVGVLLAWLVLVRPRERRLRALPTGAAVGPERAERPDTGRPYPGSALAGPGGAAPGDGFTIKGNSDSMLFHTPESPYYGRTTAEVWFASAEEAEAAGFTSWTRR